jgi:hypothetical protein
MDKVRKPNISEREIVVLLIVSFGTVDLFVFATIGRGTRAKRNAML